MVLVVTVVMVSTGSHCCRRGATVVAVARCGRGSSGGGRQVMAHGRVIRTGGHGRGGTEPVSGVRHLTTRRQVAISHGRVIHVGRGRGAGQPVEVCLVQVRVVHVNETR